MNRPPKVGHFEVPSHVDEEVLWFYVSVNDFLRVTVVECIGQLSHILWGRGGVWSVNVGMVSN